MSSPFLHNVRLSSLSRSRSSSLIAPGQKLRALACDNRVERIPERPLNANVGDSSA
ncbi:MAG: hypothetical protein ACR2MQ_13885 [Gemmatimonadaceae bacterium]